MTKPEQLPDGSWEVALPDGRVASGNSPQALQRIASAMRQAEDARSIFLDTWKVAVRTAGPQFFKINAESIDSATDKNQLRPDMAAINAGILSACERRFIVALLSFFNGESAAELCRAHGETGQPGELAAHLDRDRLQIITDLMLSYEGW